MKILLNQRLFTLVCVLFLIVTSLAADNKPPNVLIVIADDLNKDSVGVYGNKDVKTPNIDLLANEGMRFNLAFTSTAMCAPTRQQMYTGLYPVKSGAYPNHSKVKQGTKSLVHYLKALGFIAIGHAWIKVLEVCLKEYDQNKNFYEDKIQTANFYFKRVLPRVENHFKTATTGSDYIMNFKFN